MVDGFLTGLFPGLGVRKDLLQALALGFPRGQAQSGESRATGEGDLSLSIREEIGLGGGLQQGDQGVQTALQGAPSGLSLGDVQRHAHTTIGLPGGVLEGGEVEFPKDAVGLLDRDEGVSR